MSIRVVGAGKGFEISTGNVDEGQNVNYKYNGQDASFTVNGFNDQERRRGWSQPGSGHNDVLAWRVDNTVVLMRKPGQDFMGQLPDNRSLADVTLAGTHESTSITGGFISECQTVDTAQQLRDGARFIDVRLRIINGELQTYHGIQSQGSTWQQQVNWIESFLKEHPRETLIVSVKQEQDAFSEFPGMVYDLIKGSGMWSFGSNIPNLGDVRGKALLFTRYSDGNYAEGTGIHPTTWPDSLKDGFEWDCSGTPFRIHDWYNIPGATAVGDKANALINHLSSTTEPRGDGAHPFTLDFASAAKFPDATPKWVATGSSSGGIAGLIGAGASIFANLTGNGNGNNASKFDSSDVGVNARLVKWLLERAAEGKRPRAVLMLDFYRDNMTDDGNLATLLAALNFVTDD